MDIVSTTSQEEEGYPTRKDVSLNELSECLGVPLFGTTESGCQAQPESKTDQLTEIITQKSVENHFPKPPADLQKNLQQHLLNIQETVIKHLLNKMVILNALGLMGPLIGCYHQKTFSHLDSLLQDSPSAHYSNMLLNWVLKTYLRYLQSMSNSSPLPQLQDITQTRVIKVNVLT